MLQNFFAIFLLSLCIGSTLLAQENDTTLVKEIQAITVKGYRFPIEEVRQLESVQSGFITAGKKHEVIMVQDLPANLAEKTGRQIFAKVPGAFVYDMDGSGNQVNISTRGLDPHRSWEYNVRQNGVMTNSDIYAYPASHYSPPMEAIQRIEVIRGTAALQYGAQFGGMVNYNIKRGDTSRVVGFESLNTIGSYGLVSSFQAFGGKKGKFSYYAYYHKRNSEGYRANARSDAQAQYASVQWDVSHKFSARAEIGRSQYVYQVPGPLTDAMFYENPRQSTRSRNYFSPDIYVPSITLDWSISPNTRIISTSSAVLGSRSSVQFIGFADAIDSIQAATLQYLPRQVDIDQFNSYTSEARLQHDYRLHQLNSTLIFGVRYIHNNLFRRQQGKGTTGTGFDLTLIDSLWGRSIHMKTENLAIFLENLIQVSPRLELSAGMRFENGESRMSGRITYLPDEEVPRNIIHQFPLLGLSGQYHLNGKNKVYVGWSQAYRPVVFSDLIPATILEQTNPDIQDAKGHNFELGVKGFLFNRLRYDINVFELLYKNRIGSLVVTDANNQFFVLKTNIGDTRTIGVECYADYLLAQQNTYRLSVFTASSFFNGLYLNGSARNGSENQNLEGNALETVPKWISRSGLQMAYKIFYSILQFSYVSESFSDAFNTVTPSVNGARGKVPSYSVWDWNLALRVHPKMIFKFGINNLTNRQYFTKRPTGYPGQGVWSSDGRSVVATVGLRL